ncbi:MAG: Hsp20/alpha crystallin family protein [Bacillus sp. (in: firmicutes)]
MKQLRRWSPEKQPVQQFKNELSEVFQNFFDDSFFNSPGSLFNKDQALTPAMNVEEKANLYAIEVEVPGVNPEDVDVELDGNMMIIKGEKSHENKKEDKDKHMHVVEHSYGSFYRSFTLPDNIDVDHITAETKNGMLYIEIPKNKKSKPHRINVKKVTKE